jgi:hypothetical protein
VLQEYDHLPELMVEKNSWSYRCPRATVVVAATHISSWETGDQLATGGNKWDDGLF